MFDDRTLHLRVIKADPTDVGMGVARLDPEDMEKIGVDVGDVIELRGAESTLAKALPTKIGNRGGKSISIDGLTRSNAEVGLDEKVEVGKSSARTAEAITLKPLFQVNLNEEDKKYILSTLINQPVTEEDIVRVELFGSDKQDFAVRQVQPTGPVIINSTTELKIIEPEMKKKTGGELTYEYIGGLEHEISRLREMIELPLKFPEIFQKLGIEPPKGVLLHGPPGTGKTLLARALANETDANFFNISGPEVMGKYYGESEARLRNIFNDAEDAAPSIVFIDEIDSIASKRTELSGEKQVEKRVVAQLLSLMDGLESRGEVIVIGATNISDSIDPALRRPGRFDREIEVGIPDRNARKEILQIHTRPMPLSEEILLDELADATHGFVGSDLESLAKEAAMASLRRIFPDIDFEEDQGIPYSVLRDLKVTKSDFRKALKETDPSALREIFSEIPEVTWDDIGGLEKIKQNLIETIQWPFEHENLFEEAGTTPPKGILLFGEPGTGKTLLAKAVANEANTNFISVNASNFVSKWVGESERKISEVFKKARQAAPCVLFFDEIDSLTPERGGAEGNQVIERVVSQLLVELDGTEELHGVVVIGATNRPDIIDPALLRSGRFDVQLELNKPGLEARKEIFEVHIREKPISPDVDLHELAEETKGLVGADIESICQEASLHAIRRVINQEGELEIEKRDFIQAKKSAINL